ncbi:Zinc finger MYM-type protein 3 [Portunus trituberculatus]|uniref:Zinc finger MYM-type protein 3 n=1 Tax=Portunus trituberculatus TaxID=210409 RepID=A0A5B7END2_PORTR|nr:Zinc finger MYM-type protein 3 [Portunus trituberculatus]
MNAEDVAHYLYHGGHQLRVFCSDSCVNVFILSARKIVVCEACKVKKYNFDMIHRQVDEDFRDYFFCSLNCLDCKEPIVNGMKYQQVTAELLRLLTPPTMVNKTTSCRPHTTTKGVYCKPHPWHRQTQTESSDTDSKAPAVLPVPVPIYVPTPMMTYSMPYPVPVFVPIPLPVPIFIPTTARTTTDIAKMMNKIQDEMPEDPYEAEMVMLARASSESIEAETPAEKTQKNPSPPTACENPAVIDELKDVDVSCLDTVEDDIPRLSLKPSDATNIVNSMTEAENVDSEEEGEEQNRKKRKLQHEDGNPKKKMLLSGSHEPASVSDPEREPQSTSSLSAVHLEEEYPDTFLNVSTSVEV